MNSSPNCVELLSLTESTECQFDKDSKDKNRNSLDTIKIEYPVDTKIYHSALSESNENSFSNAMKMPSSTLENISLISPEPPKNEIISNNNNNQTSSPSKTEAEVMLLVSEMTDIVEGRDKESKSRISNDHDNSEKNDFSTNCGTLLYSKNNDTQPQNSPKNKHDENNIFDMSEQVPKSDMNSDDSQTESDSSESSQIVVTKSGNLSFSIVDVDHSKNKSDRNGFPTYSKQFSNSPSNNTQNNGNFPNDQTLVSLQDGFNSFSNDFDNSFDSSKQTLDDSLNFDSFTNETEIMNQIFHNEPPIALLSSKLGSCSFVDRKIQIIAPVKIGRAVARLRPASDNAVFDCKVLSRNHALLHYQDGRFYLRDAGSSNGTFINNVRLSNTGKKSKPHEVFSGDLLQFGVEVTEKKQVHNCVIAEIRLYHPDGSEARKPYNESSLSTFQNQNEETCFVINGEQITQYDGISLASSSGFYLSTGQMIELSHFIKESMHKQSLLENQLESIKNLMDQARDSAALKWHSVVKEDLLMSRVEILQDKIVALTMSKSMKEPLNGEFSIDDLSKELNDALNEKEQFELKMKAILQEVIEDKAMLIENLNSSEKKYQTKQLECDNLQNMLEQNYKQTQELINNSEQSKKELSVALSKVKQLEQAIAEFEERNTKNEIEKNELMDKMNSAIENDGCQPPEVPKIDAQTEISPDNSLNESSNISSQVNGDILLQNNDSEEIQNSLTNVVSSLQKLYSEMSENKMLKIFEFFHGRLSEIEQRLVLSKQELKNKETTRKESMNKLLLELECKQTQNKHLADENAELCSQIDKLNHEVEIYKIDLQTLQSQQIEQAHNDKECSNENIKSNEDCIQSIDKESQTDDVCNSDLRFIISR